MISLVLTNYNRCDNIKNIISNNATFDEILINDDYSDIKIFKELESFCKNFNNVNLYRNNKNVGAFHNKHIAMTKAKNEWCVLFDSDNHINNDYLDVLQKLDKWETDVIYQPSYFSFNFDYRKLAGDYLNDVKLMLLDSVPELDNRGYGPLFNAGNYFVNKGAYIEVSDEWKDILKYVEVESFLFLWFKMGRRMYVTPNLTYNHVRSDDSFYFSHQKWHMKMTDYIKYVVSNNLEFDKDEIQKINNSK